MTCAAPFLPASPGPRRSGGWLAPALGWLLCLLLASLAGWAQAQERADDPPARAGRVAGLDGQAWWLEPESGQWQPLLLNQTLGPGERLRSAPQARLSLRIGSTSLWLDGDSELLLRRLDDEAVELQLLRGSLALRLRQRELLDEFRVFTREGDVTAEREGLYRVEQLARAGGSRVQSWEGRLRFEWREREAGDPVWLSSGEQAELWWSGGPRAERQALQRDVFGDWGLAQSRAEGPYQAWNHVSPEMTGAEVLDAYGQWEQHPEHGVLWVPSAVAPDWEPYRQGRWLWSVRWGWTWVDAAPWGFAPFHYGRWLRWGGRWCWAPGAYTGRPVYAPALVGWGAGRAPGWSRHQPPPPGWQALGPRQPYVPHYRHSPGYGQRLNDPPVTVRPPSPRWEPPRTPELPRPDWRFGERREGRQDGHQEGRQDVTPRWQRPERPAHWERDRDRPAWGERGAAPAPAPRPEMPRSEMPRRWEPSPGWQSLQPQPQAQPQPQRPERSEPPGRADRPGAEPARGEGPQRRHGWSDRQRVQP